MKRKSSTRSRAGTRRSHKPLWEIAIITTAEAEDAVSAALSESSGTTVSSYTDAETKETRVAAYLETKPDSATLRKELAAALDNIRRCGLNIGAGRISIQRIRREDWADSWKRHFKAITIGSSLLIKPSWIKRKPRPRQAVVILDPGLSFGTGQHPTTSFCLRQLVAKRGKNGTSLLDIGTGSGILAIAAAKLDYAPVVAFDFDPESVRVAKENAKTNRVERRILLSQADLTKLPKRSREQFDVVCANLISTLLISERERIINRVKQDGTLILAGILASEFHLVEQAYAEAGFKLLASKQEKEWRSGAFTRR